MKKQYRPSIKDLGDQISVWRQFAGLTQSELESRAGLAHNALSRIETGQVSPRVGTVEKIATALSLSIEELQFRTPPVIPIEEGIDAVQRLADRISSLQINRQQAVLDAFNKLLDQMDAY